MMEHSIAYYLGVAAGIAVVAVAGIIVRVLFKKKLFSCEYDERQELIRGRAVKYGFWIMIVYFAGYGLFADILDFRYIKEGTICILGVGIGVAVFAIYAIWHDAYYSLTESPARYSILFGAIMILNLFGGVQFLTKSSYENEKISPNLIFAVVFFVILVAQVLKTIKDKRNREMD